MQITMRPPLGNVKIPLQGLAAAFPRLPKLSTAVIRAVVLTAAGAGLLTGRVLPAANQIDLRFRYAPPWPLAGSSRQHLLGTDRLGRDLLRRMLVGTQNSLSVTLLAIVFAAAVGTCLGLVAGYLGGWVDSLIMRCVDIVMSCPAILVALVFVVTVGASFAMVVATLAMLLWAQYALLVRGQVLSVKERECCPGTSGWVLDPSDSRRPHFPQPRQQRRGTGHTADRLGYRGRFGPELPGCRCAAASADSGESGC
jgi:ABC-type dipeptide/oligopeptide/nickel transport system permease subunit